MKSSVTHLSIKPVVQLHCNCYSNPIQIISLCLGVTFGARDCREVLTTFEQKQGTVNMCTSASRAGALHRLPFARKGDASEPHNGRVGRTRHSTLKCRAARGPSKAFAPTPARVGRGRTNGSRSRAKTPAGAASCVTAGRRAPGTSKCRGGQLANAWRVTGSVANALPVRE